jgi:DNA repair protein RadD
MESRTEQEVFRLLRGWGERFPGIVEEYQIARSRDEGGKTAPTGPAADLMLARRTLRPALFDYQSDLASEFGSVLARRHPANTALLSLPTGAGKTRTAAVGLIQLLSNNGALCVYWLAPTKELLGQAHATLYWAWHQHGEAADMRIVRADMTGEFVRGACNTVFLATPQMVHARSKKGEVAPSADLVIFDEAHQMGAQSFAEAVSWLRRDGGAVIGLSATPGRTNHAETESLVEYFHGRLLTSPRLGSRPVEALERRGIFSRVGFRRVPGAKSSISPRSRFNLTAKLAATVGAKRRVLVFAPSVATAYGLGVLSRRMGVSTGVISAGTPDLERRQILADFERGTIKVLFNKALLATGYDCPAVSDVILGAEVRSPILFEQIVGRVTRGPAVGGAATSTVWEFESHLDLHGIPSSYYRFLDYDWDR